MIINLVNDMLGSGVEERCKMLLNVGSYWVSDLSWGMILRNVSENWRLVGYF